MSENHGPHDAALDLGPQPLAALLERHQLSPNALVSASEEQLTHKMVARAVKGRRLTKNTMGKLLRALNRAAAGPEGPAAYALRDLFNYDPVS